MQYCETTRCYFTLYLEYNALILIKPESSKLWGRLRCTNVDENRSRIEGKNKIISTCRCLILSSLALLLRERCVYLNKKNMLKKCGQMMTLLLQIQYSQWEIIWWQECSFEEESSEGKNVNEMSLTYALA